VAGGFDRRNYRVNFAKIREKLFFEPHYSVPDGIKELVQAMSQGFFEDYGHRMNFYRNNKMSYSSN
jgi:SAM-dependent MidA family methyltransferase